MRKSFLLYLFVFTALLAIFMYVSGRQMLESKNERIIELEQELERSKKLTDSLFSELENHKTFTLPGNEGAMTYLEERGLDPMEVMDKVRDEIINRNKADADNDLIPYAGMNGYFRVNKMKFLNHKWLIASFTDGRYWGDLLLTFSFDENGDIILKPSESLLYPVD